MSKPLSWHPPQPARPARSARPARICHALAVWCFAAAVLGLPSAHGFGAKGHRLIAEVAQSQLDAPTSSAVRALLDGQTLVQVATWADEVREQRRDTAPWHYMNFGADCRYQSARDCPDGRCLVPQIEAHLRVLTDRTASVARRGEALRFVVHLHGDLHQPLHLGWARDKGGNQFQIAFDQRRAALPLIDAADPRSAARQRWWQQRVQGYNLHSLWDTQMLESAALSPRKYLQLLQALPAPDPQQLQASIAQIAEHSCQMVRSEGFYPPRNRINRAYVEQQRPVLERQLRLAGERLAVLLNRLL